jgi:iron complex outermembrane receptor protein
MRKSHAYQASFIAIAAATLLGHSAFAQTAPAPAAAAAPAAEPAGLEEVVVVARRTEERLQDVPVTVTAITPQTLRQTQISQGTDLIKLIPTLNVQQGATGPNTNYALRGIRDGVIAYLNDVPVSPFTGAVDDQIWDLSSVQALAGPQGTLFGKSATGGAILFRTQLPTKTFGGYVDASYGSYNTEQLTGVLNLPVNDMWQLRLGARLDKHDGFVKNVGGGPDMQSKNRDMFRISSVFQPTSNITDTLVLDYSHRDEVPVALISSDLVQGGTGAMLYGQGLLNSELAQQQAFGIRKISTPFGAYDKTTNWGASNVLAVGLGHGMTFKYILGFRYTNSDDESSKTGLTVPMEVGQNGITNGRQWTNELQLQGKTLNDRLSYTIGYFDLQYRDGSVSNYQLFGAPGEAFLASNNITHYNTDRNATQAEYIQASYAITDKFNLTAGVRYNHDTASIYGTSHQPEFFFSGPQVCGLTEGTVGVDFANCIQNQSLSSTATTYTISLDYHLSKNVLLYFTTRKGYNGGGFNGGIPADAPAGAPQSSYLPEYVTDYEIGAKTESTIAGMPVRANVSVYEADYTQIQRSSFGNTPSGPYAGIANGPKAQIYGAQLESLIKPTRDFTITLNYGYLHTGYTEGAPGFPKGNTFGQAPEHSLNLGGNYHHDLDLGGAATASISYAYQSQITFMDSNIDATTGLPLLHYKQPGYGVVDAQVGWERVLNSPVDVTFWVKNLTDVAYAIEKEDQTALLGFTGTVYNDPRTFGIALHYRFGG